MAHVKNDIPRIARAAPMKATHAPGERKHTKQHASGSSCSSLSSSFSWQPTMKSVTDACALVSFFFILCIMPFCPHGVQKAPRITARRRSSRSSAQISCGRTRRTCRSCVMFRKTFIVLTIRIGSIHPALVLVSNGLMLRRGLMGMLMQHENVFLSLFEPETNSTGQLARNWIIHLNHRV